MGSQGFRGSAALRAQLMNVGTRQQLQDILGALPPDEPFPPRSMRVKRGKTAGTQKVALPDGYLDDLDDATPPCAEAEDATSGG